MTGSGSDGRVADLRLILPAAGCWTVTLTGVVAGAWVAGAATVVCALVSGSAWWIVHRRRNTRLSGALMVVVAVAGITAGFGAAITTRAAVVAQSPLAAPGLVDHKVSVVLWVVDDPRAVRGPGPPRVRLPVRAQPVRRSGAPVAATVTAPEEGWSDLVPGQRVRAVVTVDRPYRSDLTAAALRASAPPSAVARPPRHQRWAAAVRQRFAAQSRRGLPAQESGLLPGLVLGDTGGLSQDVADDFRAAGLTHLTAVSGANFAIICGAVLLVLRAVGVPRVPAVVLTMAVSVCFVIVVRPSPSVVRAAIMGGVGLFALIANRGSQAVPALAVAVIVVLAIWPAMSVDPGFALSVAATAGLIALAPRVRDRLLDRGVPRGVAEVLAVAGTAQLVTIPLVVMISGSIGLVGMLANIAVAPAVAPITVLGTVAATVGGVSTVAAGILIRWCEPPLWWMLHVARVLAGVPGATVAVPDGVMGALLTASVLAVALAVGVLVSRRWPRGRWSGPATGVAPSRRRSVVPVWHDERRDRPTPPPRRRRRLPRRAFHRRHPRRRARGRRRSDRHPGARR